MKKSIKEYWNKYYNSHAINDKPSNFAIFVSKRFVKKDTILLDVGSGDGRDAFHHGKKAKSVLGIDLSDKAIKQNKMKVKRLEIDNIFFKNLSSNDLIKVNYKDINLIYARFFLHAINERDENKFLKGIIKNFKKETLVAIEFRTLKDVLMKKGKKISKHERLTDHYRRFIDPQVFEKKLIKMNFEILYRKLGINLSKSLNDNPHLCRLVFIKK